MSEFWLNWSVNLAIAVGTIGAVIVALWGPKIRAAWFRPSLVVKLMSPPLGKRIAVTLYPPDGGPSRVVDGRYCQLCISNPDRSFPANDVEVLLQRIEMPGPDGALQTEWEGGEAGVPLRWTHANVRPLQRRIGAEVTCDLCSILKDKGVILSPVLTPSNMLDRLTVAGTMVVTVQARGTECDSARIRIQIAWDGQWNEGDAEMARHLVIKQLDDAFVAA